MENGIKKILRDKYGLFEKDIEILLEKFTKFSVPKREKGKQITISILLRKGL
jgi:hypothetical protein